MSSRLLPPGRLYEPAYPIDEEGSPAPASDVLGNPKAL
jgi:hypothetical protein